MLVQLVMVAVFQQFSDHEVTALGIDPSSSGSCIAERKFFSFVNGPEEMCQALPSQIPLPVNLTDISSFFGHKT